MAKVLKYVKFSLVVLIFLGLIAYIIFAMLDMSKPDPEERCTNVEFIISQEEDHSLINTKNIEMTLKAKHIYPKGRPMVLIDTKEIEKAIKENKFIEEVNCYKTAQGKVCIKISQRTPILYVIPEGKDGYYVDKTGYVIPVPTYTSDIMIATGWITEKFAKEELAEFGTFVKGDEFWNNQIEQVYVIRGPKNRPHIELVPRVGDNLIYLGSIEDYQKKLRRLRIFYDKAMGTVGWNKYARINLEYNNQIICTKKEKEK